MSDRDRGGRGRREQRGTAGSSPDPVLPDDVSAADLDGEFRRDLRSLEKVNAERVARHLVMVTQMLDDDPALALEHARAARRRAGRVGLVRETAGIAAYNAGEWQEALSELRAARRITGTSALLPLIADAERGIGRPERAIEIARSEEGRALTGDEASEMRIVEAGARIDLNEPEKALVTLRGDGLKAGDTGTAAARLYYAYASALLAAGRTDDAVTWFMNAASADVDDVTDAEDRIVAITDGDDTEDPGAEGPDAEEPETEQPGTAQAAAVGTIPGPPGAAITDGGPSTAAPASTATDTVDLVAGGTRAETPATDDTATAQEPGLLQGYDAVLFDLDGTLFAGQQALPGAVDAVDRVTVPYLYVTNNASRRPSEVAAHLADLGFTATTDQVVTSAQSAARLLAEHVEPGSRALVVGTEGLAQEVREVGVGATRSADDRPAAVIQGHSPDTGWAQLSEAVLAVNAGALWIACNIDATLPSERGLLVGNGSMVAAVANATGKEPLVAGKPAAPLMADAIARSKATRPLVVGDRLDTDIEGAHAVGIHSLLVLTGVSTATDLLAAPPQQRPTYVAADLSALFLDADTVRIGDHPDWQVAVRDGNTVTVVANGPVRRETLVPALVAAVWAAIDDGALVAADLVVSSVDAEVRDLLAGLGVHAVG